MRKVRVEEKALHALFLGRQRDGADRGTVLMTYKKVIRTVPLSALSLCLLRPSAFPLVNLQRKQ